MNKEIRIDLGKIFHSVKEKWWIIVICGAICFSLATLVTMKSGNDGYSANTTVYSMSYSSLEEAASGASAINAYSNIITSRKVAESAKAMIGEKYEVTEKDIQQMISVSSNSKLSASQSVVITITARSENKALAVDVANAVANAFVNEMRNLTGTTTVQILDSAQNATLYNDSARNQLLIRMLGLLIGLVLPIVVIFFMEIFSEKVYRLEDITLDGEMELIGVIPDYDNN